MLAHAAGFFVTLSTRGGQIDGTVSVAVDDSEMAVLDELMRYVRDPRPSAPTQHAAWPPETASFILRSRLCANRVYPDLPAGTKL